VKVREEAEKRASAFIDEAIRLQRDNGIEVQIADDVYRSVVTRTARLFEESMRIRSSEEAHESDTRRAA
jgi:hypothetical protein